MDDNRSRKPWSMMGRKYDLRQLKQAVPITDVLAHYRLDANLRLEQAELVGPCPLPEHTGDRDNRSAFRVCLQTGRWHCFTHCSGGDIVSLVARMEGNDYAAAARVLAFVERRPSTTPTCDRFQPTRPSSHRPFSPYTRRLRLNPTHPLLRARGITPQTARTFEAGGWPMGGFLQDCVGVRLHDIQGRPLGYAGRRLDDQAARRLGKWKLPTGLPRSELLFNWHRAQPAHHSTLIVVEGPFDAMRVWQAGHPNVVALLGSSPTPAQVHRLAQVEALVIMLDADGAGRAGAHRLTPLTTDTPVRLVELPEGNDPADLPEPVLQRLLSFSF